MRLTIAAGVVVLSTMVAGEQAVSPDLQALVQTERDFAKAATVKGLRDSFLEFFADDAIALVVDIVEERAASAGVVNGASQRVHVGARVELDGVEHLFGSNVARGAGHEAPARLGRDANGAHHAEIDDDRRQRLHDGRVAVFVRVEAFATGERLPPERDLARRLGVSRPVVREAMVALEIAGLVEVRTGSGSYVRGAPTGNVAFRRGLTPIPLEIDGGSKGAPRLRPSG